MSDDALGRRITRVEKAVHALEAKYSECQNEDTHNHAHSALENKSPHDAERADQTEDDRYPHIYRSVFRFLTRIKWETWKDILWSLGIIAGVVYAVITYRQWSDANTHFMIDERAWIRLGPTPPQWPQLDSFNYPKVTASIVNFGKSTITYIGYLGALEVVDSSESPPFEKPHKDSTTTQMFLYPSDTSSVRMELFDDAIKDPTKAARTFTQKEVDDLTSGKAYLAAFGWFIYTDQFGMHWYRFCLWHGYHEGSSYESYDCVVWNRIGDGIPPSYLLTADERKSMK